MSLRFGKYAKPTATAAILRTGLVVAAGGFVIIGLVLLQNSSAASFMTATEAETGTLAGAASKFDSPQASDGSAVKFSGGTTPPTPSPSDPGKVVFHGGYESGNTGEYAYQHGSVNVVISPVRDGRYAAKYSGSGSQRAQLDRGFTFKEGNEYYIGLSVFFPNEFNNPPSWALFFQLHGPPYTGSPPLSLDMGDGDGRIKLSTHNPNSSGKIVHWTSPMAKNRWMDFTLRVKFTQSSSGFFELWMDGNPQTFANGSKRVTRTTMIDRYEIYPTPTAYMGSGSATFYHDALRVGTTYASVQPR